MNATSEDVLKVEALQETSFRALLAVMTSFLSYGIHIALALCSMYLILATRKHGPYFKFHITYIALLLCLGTVNVVLWASFMTEGTKVLFLEEMDPYLEQLPVTLVVHGATYAGTSVAITALSVGLLLYRCYIIYAMRLWVVILPGLLYVASIVIGIVDLAIFWHSRHYHQFIPNETVHQLTKAYWFMLLSLNILLTLLIIGRILWMRRVISPGQFSSLGGGVITCLVESSALYTAAALVGLGFNWWFFRSTVLPRQTYFVLISLEASPFNPYLTHIECVASEFIILRVAMGRSWTTDSSPSSLSANTGHHVQQQVDQLRFTIPSDSFTSSSSPPDPQITLPIPDIERAGAEENQMEKGTRFDLK